MSDFNPVTLFFIAWETFGVWLLAPVVLGLVLLAGVVTGIGKLRRVGRPARRPLRAALAMGTLATVIFTLLVPKWTLAGIDALAGPVDWLFAVLIALVPSVLIAMAVFSVASRKCAARAVAG